MRCTGAPGEYRAFRRQKYAGTRFLLGCNPSMKGDLAHDVSPRIRRKERIGRDDGERRENGGRSGGEGGARAESSEVHVSQYLSRPKLDFRNFSRRESAAFQDSAVRSWFIGPLACPRACPATTRFISISGALRYVRAAAPKSTPVTIWRFSFYRLFQRTSTDSITGFLLTENVEVSKIFQQC